MQSFCKQNFYFVLHVTWHIIYEGLYRLHKFMNELLFSSGSHKWELSGVWDITFAWGLSKRLLQCMCVVCVYVCVCVCLRVCVCTVSIEQRPLQCNPTPALCLSSSSPQTANQSDSLFSKSNSLVVSMILFQNDYYWFYWHELKLHIYW